MYVCMYVCIVRLPWNHFSSYGNFKVCKSNLKDKVRLKDKAILLCYSSLSRLLKNTTRYHKYTFQFTFSTLMILLNGSEVWGICDKDDFTNWEKYIIEKTHIFLRKQSLGVNKQCPNVAARNEPGRFIFEVNHRY